MYLDHNIELFKWLVAPISHHLGCIRSRGISVLVHSTMIEVCDVSIFLLDTVDAPYS
jgi:hypothetical protein